MSSKLDNKSISGGEVHAYGGDDAAGIGAGEETTSGPNIWADNTTISGGTVEAFGGGNGAGIGAYKEKYFGTLNIGKGVKTMSIETDYSWSTIPVDWNPVAFAQQRCHVQIQTCDHPGYTAQTCIFCKH